MLVQKLPSLWNQHFWDQSYFCKLMVEPNLILYMTSYLGSIPGLGRSHGEGNGYPLQYSGLENSIDCIVHGVGKSQTQLGDFQYFSFKKDNIKIKKKWKNRSPSPRRPKVTLTVNMGPLWRGTWRLLPGGPLFRGLQRPSQAVVQPKTPAPAESPPPWTSPQKGSLLLPLFYFPYSD